MLATAYLLIIQNASLLQKIAVHALLPLQHPQSSAGWGKLAHRRHITSISGESQ
jgi:hypothetical protein